MSSGQYRSHLGAPAATPLPSVLPVCTAPCHRLHPQQTRRPHSPTAGTPSPGCSHFVSSCCTTHTSVMWNRWWHNILQINSLTRLLTFCKLVRHNTHNTQKCDVWTDDAMMSFIVNLLARLLTFRELVRHNTHNTHAQARCVKQMMPWCPLKWISSQGCPDSESSNRTTHTYTYTHTETHTLTHSKAALLHLFNQATGPRICTVFESKHRYVHVKQYCS